MVVLLRINFEVLKILDLYKALNLSTQYTLHRLLLLLSKKNIEQQTHFISNKSNLSTKYLLSLPFVVFDCIRIYKCFVENLKTQDHGKP